MAVTETEAAARQAFGDALRRLRNSRGWSLQELRDATLAAGHKTTPQQVGQWEAGATAPGPTAMAAVETAIGAPGLGLIMGIDTGGLARLTEEVSDLRDRVDALEGEGATRSRRSATVKGPATLSIARGTSDPPVAIAASGADLEQLRLDDPDAYAEIERKAAEALDRARRRDQD